MRPGERYNRSEIIKRVGNFMKALVYWCRWHGATLRLRGRDAQSVWGELAYTDHTEPFHFYLQTGVLLRGEGEQTSQVRLDEMGVEQATE